MKWFADWLGPYGKLAPTGDEVKDAMIRAGVCGLIMVTIALVTVSIRRGL